MQFERAVEKCGKHWRAKKQVVGLRVAKPTRQDYLSAPKWQCILFEMKTESKLSRQKKAAKEIAEIMYASLQQFSKEEQERRLKEIHKIAVKSKPSRKPSKRSSTRGNSRVSRPASAAR